MTMPTQQQFNDLKQIGNRFAIALKQFQASIELEEKAKGVAFIHALSLLVEYKELEKVSFESFAKVFTAENLARLLPVLHDFEQFLFQIIADTSEDTIRNLETLSKNHQQMRKVRRWCDLMGSFEELDQLLKLLPVPAFETSVAISHLEFHRYITQRSMMDEARKAEELACFDRDIALLRQDPNANVEQLMKKLRHDQSPREITQTPYGKRVIFPLLLILQDLPIVENMILDKTRVPTLYPYKDSPAQSALGFFNRPQPIQKDNDIDEEKVIAQLKAYISERKSEWEYHYNFLNLVGFVYYFSDALFKTDYLNTKSREIKLNAATKCIQILQGDTEVKLTPSEKLALGDARLGKITSKCEILINQNHDDEIVAVAAL